MFAQMRRKNQQLSEEQSIAVLKRGASGVLALAGGEYPYALPLSYVYDQGKVYFHCARSGYKLKLLEENSKVSFCVVDQDRVIPEEYTTYFRSVILFGRARILQEETQKRAALEKLARKYSPGLEEGARQEIERQLGQVCLVEITIDHLSGKEAIELARAKK
jgi:nitroimidazol reductase NimA-like FMN-containing flavoprotein (pyridoxamine 5'-phosphate oxidase superfamily)